MSWAIRTEIRKARKDHVCSGCLGSIPKGTRYFFGVWADGEISTAKLCPKCHYVFKEGLFWDECWPDGALRECHDQVPDDYVIPEKVRL